MHSKNSSENLWDTLRSLFWPRTETQTRSKNDTHFLYLWMGISLFFHLLAAYFSVGYQAVDEHFQILEFLSYKLGGAPAQDLPVEFAEKMRPWLQVSFYWVIVHTVKFFGITNPHHWIVAIRGFTGVLGWLSLLGLAHCSRFWFGDRRTLRVATLLLATLWYFPVMHVRPSSEGLGGTAFVLGLSVLFLAWKKSAPFQKPWAWILGGALLGLSFEARFQMALMIAGLVLWFVWIARTSWKNLALLTLGLTCVFLLGRWADRWGYGVWNLSPWNYFSYNLIRGEVSRFGQSPWWDVFRMSVTESWPFLGILTAFLCVVGWLRFPRHIVTWCHLPFFIVHCLISHKEYRFFFPIGNSAPIVILLSLVSTRTLSLPQLPAFFSRKTFRVVGILAFALLVFNNLVGLISLSVIPLARNIQYQEAVSQRLTPGQRFRIYTTDRDPFVILGNPTYFFRPQELDVQRISDLRELASLPKKERPFWFFDGKLELTEELKKELPFCQRTFSTLPAWIVYFNWNQWLSRANVWALYECN